MSVNLLAVYRRTAAGEAELSTPQNGLSLNQRKLLQWSDGQLPVSQMIEKLAAGHTVDPDKVVVDVEKLEALKLVEPVGTGVRAMATTSVAGEKKKRPLVWLVAGAAVVAVAGIGLMFSARGTSHGVQSGQVTRAGADATQEEEEKLLGVMPNPSRWFSPTPKPEVAPPQSPEAEKPGADKAAAEKAKQQPAQLAQAGKTPEPAATTPTPAASASQPQLAPVTQPAPQPQSAPQPQPAAPVSQPVTKPVELAAAPAPAPAPVAAPRAPNTRPIYREQPDFPAEAARADITSGTVRARMSVDPSGRVVKVEILDARPRKVFDRAVMTALARWKFEPAGTPFTVDTQIDFKQD